MEDTSNCKVIMLTVLCSKNFCKYGITKDNINALRTAAIETQAKAKDALLK